MRRGLFWKLFLLQVLAAATLLVGALAVTRGLAIRSFGDYLEARERENVGHLADEIGRAYEERGSLEKAAAGIQRLDDPPPREFRNREAGPDRPEGAPRETTGVAGSVPAGAGSGAANEHVGEPPPFGPRPSRRRGRLDDGEGPMPPIQLQDAEGRYVRGEHRAYAAGDGDAFRQPVEANGHVVGYIAWRKFPAHPAQAEFAGRQERGFALVGAVALVLAGLFAAWITAVIVRPIRALSAGTAALGRREFSTRVPEERGDELGQLAGEFNRLAAALEGYDARQRQWLADIAHELRTPVSVLQGELEALIDGIRPATPDTLRSIHEEVGRLSKLIEDLHLLSLAESNGLRLAFEDADAGDIAAAAAMRFRERFAARGFVLELRTTEGLHLHADVQRLEQVLANLLENALRHATPPGPVILSADAAEGRVWLSVSDAGPGVPADALPRLFDRLFRVDAARNRSYGGAGLGLAICRSIVAAHGGTIRARRSEAGGLAVEISLERRTP